MEQTIVRRLLTLAALLPSAVAAAEPFALTGPDTHPEDFRITTFADGLNFPVGMTELDDGSLLVATSNGGSLFGSSTGSLVRLADKDGDGVADERQTLVDDVPGGRLTSVRRAGSLVFVTGQGTPITVYRSGTTEIDPLAQIAQIQWDYPSGGWLHPHSALQAVISGNDPELVHLFFQLGSRDNFAPSVDTVSITSTENLALQADLAGESLYRVDLLDDGSTLAAAGPPVRIATGLRNAAGMVFHPDTGDLYLEDNGIDGLSDPNEPTSADELNRLTSDEAFAAEEPVDFGFPHSYVEYRSGTLIGRGGREPLVAFQPLPMPDGIESEGPNDLVLAPPTFPEALRDGIFVGFHGRFGAGGTANEENPVVFVDTDDYSYFHFIQSTEAQVGHLDGLLSTDDSLFLADISPSGGLGGSAAGTGRIYQIRYLPQVVPEPTCGALAGVVIAIWILARRVTRAS